MDLVFGVEQRRIAVRAPQALIVVVVCEAPALSRCIRVAQRNILANADSICGGRQCADSKDSSQAGYERGHKTRQEAPPPTSGEVAILRRSPRDASPQALNAGVLGATV